MPCLYAPAAVASARGPAEARGTAAAAEGISVGLQTQDCAAGGGSPSQVVNSWLSVVGREGGGALAQVCVAGDTVKGFFVPCADLIHTGFSFKKGGLPC